jgi:hypothetical protein
MKLFLLLTFYRSENLKDANSRMQSKQVVGYSNQLRYLSKPLDLLPPQEFSI